MGRKTDALIKGLKGAKSSVESLTLLKLTIARIKVVRNKRSISAQKLRKEIANLIQSGQDAHVYITKADVLIKEENLVAAYDLIEHFCESIIGRFPIIESQRAPPIDMKEPIASLVYAAPRCTDLAELKAIKDMFVRKYGKEFANSVEELRPDCGVNRVMIEKLTTRLATGETKLKLMEEICKEHQIQWTPGESISGRSPSNKSSEGNQQNEGPSLSKTITEGKAEAVQVGEVMLLRNDNEADHLGDSTSALFAQKNGIFGQVGTSMTLRKDSRHTPSTEVAQVDNSSPPAYQVTSVVHVDMKKQMGIKETDDNIKLKTDKGRMQHVFDDIEGVSTHSGNESYVSAEEGDEEGEEEGEGEEEEEKEEEEEERKTLDVTAKLQREDPLSSESLRTKNLEKLEIHEEAKKMEGKSLSANSMKEGSSGASQTKRMETVSEETVTESKYLVIQSTKRENSFQENDKTNILSSRIEQIPLTRMNPGVPNRIDSVNIPGITADAKAVAAEAVRLALLYAEVSGSPIPESVNLNDVIGTMPTSPLQQGGKQINNADQVSSEEKMEEKETWQLKELPVNKSDDDDDDDDGSGVQNPAGTVVTGGTINSEDYTWGDDDDDVNKSSTVIPEPSTTSMAPEDEYLNSIFSRHSQTVPQSNNPELEPIFQYETMDVYNRHPSGNRDKIPDAENSGSQIFGDVYKPYGSREGSSSSYKSKLFDEGSTSYKNKTLDESPTPYKNSESLKFDEGATSFKSMIFDQGSNSDRNRPQNKGSESHKTHFNLNDDLDELPLDSDRNHKHTLVPIYDDVPEPDQYDASSSGVGFHGDKMEEAKLEIGDAKSEQGERLPEDGYDKPGRPQSRRTKKPSTPTVKNSQHTNDVLSGLKMNQYGMNDQIRVKPESFGNQGATHQDDSGYALDQSRHRPSPSPSPSARKQVPPKPQELTESLSNQKLENLDHKDGSNYSRYGAPARLDVAPGNRSKQQWNDEEQSQSSWSNRKMRTSNREDGAFTEEASDEIESSFSNRRHEQLRYQEKYQRPQSRPDWNDKPLVHGSDQPSYRPSTLMDEANQASENRWQQQEKLHQDPYPNTQSLDNRREKIPIRERDPKYSSVGESESSMVDEVDPLPSYGRRQRYEEKHQSPQARRDRSSKPLRHGSDQLSYGALTQLEEANQLQVDRRQQQLKHQEQYPSPQFFHSQREKIPIHEGDHKHSLMGESEYLAVDEVDPLSSFNRRKQPPKYEGKYPSPQPSRTRRQQPPSEEEDTEYSLVQKIPSKFNMQDEVGESSFPYRRRVPQRLETQGEPLFTEDNRNVSTPLSNNRMKQKQRQKEQKDEEYRLDAPIEQKLTKPVDEDEVRHTHPTARRRGDQPLGLYEEVDQYKPKPASLDKLQDHGQRSSLDVQDGVWKSSSPGSSRKPSKERLKQDEVDEQGHGQGSLLDLQDGGRKSSSPGSSRKLSKERPKQDEVDEQVHLPAGIKQSSRREEDAAHRAKQGIESESSASLRKGEKMSDSKSQDHSAFPDSSRLEATMSDPVVLATIPPPKKSGPSVSVSGSLSTTISAPPALNASTTPVNTNSGATSTARAPSIDVLAANYEAMRQRRLASGSK